jgi:hypothetical protein
MKKLFGQKSKHKTNQTLSTLTGSSSKEDDLSINKKGKPQAATSSQPQVATNNPPPEVLIHSKSIESLPTEVKKEENTNNTNEKSKKLFVVVSGKKIRKRNERTFDFYTIVSTTEFLLRDSIFILQRAFLIYLFLFLRRGFIVCAIVSTSKNIK